MWNIVQTALLYSLIFFSVWFILNAIAVAYNSTQSLPFGTIVLILIIQGPLPPLSSVPVVCLFSVSPLGGFVIGLRGWGLGAG